MKTSNSTNFVQTVDRTANPLNLDHFINQYPNGYYWIIPDYQYPYNPPLPKYEPIKFVNTYSKLLNITYTEYKKPEVNILVNNNRVAKSRTDASCYISEGEFSIEIINTNSVTIGALIKMNGVSLSDQHLVIYPGQRIVLDRFINTKHKFNFKVYSVEDNNKAIEEAIKKNGDIEISFHVENFTYSEPDISNGFWTDKDTYRVHNFDQYTNVFQNTSESTFNLKNAPNTFTTNAVNLDSVKCFYNNDLKDLIQENSEPFEEKSRSVKETGMIDQGSKSNQEFTVVNKAFVAVPYYTATLKLKPLSAKPVEAKDLICYCKQCGIKVNRKDNFCSKCGTKI